MGRPWRAPLPLAGTSQGLEATEWPRLHLIGHSQFHTMTDVEETGDRSIVRRTAKVELKNVEGPYI